jgi:DAK2 domain fusion protein YloV
MQKTLNGATIRKIFIGGYAVLEKHKAAVDALNVFPVPDGDTGTNMTLTMQSVLRELESCQANDIAALSEAIAKGGLRGARGNSGVILSQILKGMTAEFKQTKTGEITVKDFARAVDEAARIAYQAVAVPREGTMLTVIRGMAAAAKESAKKEQDIEVFLADVLKKGEEVLAQTPEMLPVLKKAGVVDAGGRGVLVIFTGFLKALKGEVEGELVFTNDGVVNSGGLDEEKVANIEDLSDIEFAYCTEIALANMNKVTTMASIDALRDKLMTMGDSVNVIGDLKLLKVHVHTNTPGAAISEALVLGEIIDLKVENMLEQFRKLREKRNIPLKEQGIVAVASGEGIIGIFKELGVDYVIKGGQTMNPSADDIASAAMKVHAKNIFVFPNNNNIVLAARHAQSLVDKKNLIVIPTKTINEGIAACIGYNTEATVEENTDAFLAAMGSVKSGSVTYAVRNTQVGRFDIKEGEILGLDGKNILAKGKKVDETVLKLVEKMMTDNIVNMTLFFGEGVKEKEAAALQDKLAGKYPKCEVNMVNGGQPVYYYLLSLE